MVPHDRGRGASVRGAARPCGGSFGGHLGWGVPVLNSKEAAPPVLLPVGTRSVPGLYLRKVTLKKKESFLCIICIEKDTLTFVLKNTTTKILLLKNSYT